MAFGIILLTTCRAQKKATEETPMIAFKKAEYQKWSAGIQGGGAGYNVTLALQENSAIVLDSLYFKKWRAKLHKDTENGTYTAIIYDGSNNESLTPSGITTSKAQTELNDVYPLEGDEAVVTYRDGKVSNYQEVTLSKGEPFNNPRY